MSGTISSSTIQDALQRAKQLAAQTSGSSADHESSLKRPAGDDFDDPYANSAKQGRSSSENNGDSSRGAMMDMANPIGTLGGMPPPGAAAMAAGMMAPPMGANGGPPPVDQLVEQLEVPDSAVGLVIGRGGSEIQNIQSQSGCRVQMSQEATPSGMRTATLTGSQISVEKARQLIMEVVQRAGDRPPPGQRMDGMMNGAGRPGPGQQTVELAIPGPKCGLIIGKGGETIKNIQETAGVKMILIQDQQSAGMMPKPLRIVGDPDKVEHAKRLVEEILSSRDDTPPQGRPGPPGGGGFNAYGSPMGGPGMMGGYGPRSIGEVIVPRQSVGMIIGKGGENIKRLAAETGAKIQFKPDEDPSTPDRCAVIQGTTDQITRATHLISELVNKSAAGGASEVFYMHVPANKTGLVIGKGGETIKAICGESGAHVELSREPPPNAMEKIFVIKGTPYQIHHAQHIIRIKVGDLAPGTPVPPMAGGDYGGQAAFNPAAAAYGQQQGAWNAYGGMGGQTDPNAAAAWSAYYGQQPQQPAGAQQPFGPAAGAGGQQAYQFPQPGAQQPTAQPQQQPQPAGQQQAPAINPQTGQPDYSAQWAEYYRSLGMHEQAAMIEQQAKATQGPGGQQPPQQQQQPAAGIVPGAPQQARPQGYGGGGGQFGGPTAGQPGAQFGQYGTPQGQPQQAGYQFPAQYQ